MNLEEYKTSKIDQYKRFSETVAKILDIILTANDFKVQQIQSREKPVDSLAKKLEKRGLLESNNIENEIKDLAGCRIIFYYNSDIDRYAASALVQDNFKIVPKSYKKYYPQQNPESANDYYIADHFQIELNEARLALPEYQEFANFRCEIQITNTLFHAYAETNHDIIYKKPAIDGFGEKIINDLNDQLIEVMEKYLKPASHKIDKIHTTFIRFKEGKQLFDSDVISEIKKTTDRNSLYDILERYKDLVLPHINFIGDDINEVSEIVDISLAKSKAFHDIPIETPYGNIPGYTHEKIICLLSEIVQHVNYVNPKSVLLLDVKLYEASSDFPTKKIIVEKIKELSRYRSRILEKIGLYVQVSLIEAVEGFNDLVLLGLKDIIIAIVHETISMRLTEFEVKGKDIVFKPENLVGSENVEVLRNRAIDLLKKLYVISNNYKTKNEVLNELSQGCTFPDNLHDNLNLLKIITKSISNIVEFLIGKIDFTDLDFLIICEYKLFGIYKVICSYREHYKENEALYKELSSARDLLIKWADIVNNNEEYQVYKTLISYDPIFLVEWNDEDYLFHEKNTYREGLITQLVDKITPNDYSVWIDRFLLISKSKLNDGATFFSFLFFIKLLSNSHPQLLLMATRKPDEMSRIISYLMQGLYSSSLRNDAETLIKIFSAEGRFLSECLHVFVAVESFDMGIVESLLSSAIRNNDVYAVSYAILAAFRNEELNAIQSIIIPALDYLTTIKNTSWINQAYGYKQLDLFFSKNNSSLLEAILRNLKFSPKLSHEAKFILNGIFDPSPDLIIEYFKDRVKYSLSPESGKEYEAIPFDLHIMQERISKTIVAFELLLNWPVEIEKAASRLINLFYPEYTDVVDLKLTAFLEENPKNSDKILLVLSFYKGDVKMYRLCEKIIQGLSEGSPILAMIKSIMLGEDGIISGTGTYGLADHYQARRPKFVAMSESSNGKLSKFAKEALQDIDNVIAVHRKCGDSDEMHFAE